MLSRLWFFLFRGRCAQCGGTSSQRKTIEVSGRYGMLQLCCPSAFHDRNRRQILKNAELRDLDNYRAR